MNKVPGVEIAKSRSKTLKKDPVFVGGLLSVASFFDCLMQSCRTPLSDVIEARERKEKKKRLACL